MPQTAAVRIRRTLGRARRLAGRRADVVRSMIDRRRTGASDQPVAEPDRPLRIGLVGFFGWGNFGDELFLQAHIEQLSSLGDVHAINDMTRKPYFTRDVTEIVEQHDAFVIGGGDLVIPWQISELYWKRQYLDKPIFIVGVGVPTWKPSSERHVKRYREFFASPNVKMIVARDRESQEWIRIHLEPAIPVGCASDLVWALDPVAAVQRDRKTLGIVLRDRGNSNDDFSRVRELCDRAVQLDYDVVHIVLANKERGPDDLAVAQRFANPGEEIVVTESLTEQRRAIASCHMLASMKFHGTLVAAQQGVPAISLSSTDKTRNFLTAIDRRDLFSAYNAADLADRLPRHPARIAAETRAAHRASALGLYEELRSAIIRQCADDRVR